MKKAILILMALVLLMSLFTACNDNGSATNEAPTSAPDPAVESGDSLGEEVENAAVAGKDTIYIGTTQSIGSLQPTAGANQFYAALGLVYDFGIYIDAASGEVRSDVLENWYYEDDTTIILQLKDGVFFSNGESMTGEDVLYSMECYVFTGAQDAQQYAGYDFDNSTVSDDGLTVTLKTTDIWGPGIGAATFPVLCKSWCEEIGWDLATDEGQAWYNCPVGSGPFEVSENKVGSTITLIRREDYWGECDWPEEIKTVVFRQYNDSAAMYVDLESGNLDLCFGVSNEDMARGSSGQSENIATDVTTFGELIRFTINYDYSWMSEPEFREAIACAIDWANVAGVAGGGLYKDAATIIPELSRFNNPDVTGYTYDPDHAKELLAGLGISDGDIQLTCIVQDKAVYTDAAESIQYYLSEVGIGMEIKSYDRPTSISMLKTDACEDNYASVWGGATFTGDPYAWCPRYFASTSGTWATVIQDETASTMWDDINNMVESDGKIAAYQDFEAYLTDNYLVFPFMEYVTGVAYNADLIDSVQLTTDQLSQNWKIDCIDWNF